ncbi:amidohydrolase family protein, partial [Chloroflexota bacterium]
MWDWLITGARVVDGTGNPWYWADVALQGDRIEAVGKLCGDASQHRLDAEGLILAPGFIDSHTHAEAYAVGDHPGETAKVAQGVTTDIMGLCGLSAFPVAAGRLEPLQEYLSGATAGERLAWEWQGYADLVSYMTRRKRLINVCSMVGHGSVRLAVMG